MDVLDLDWMTAESEFANALPNFQPRLNQRNLALKAEDVLDSRRHLLAQAGCGTGKSFVGILAAARLSKATGRPAVYATGTKALQDQLSEKDLPFLQSIFDFKFAVIKGRSNYVCKAKVAELPDLTKNAVEDAISELGETFTGEAADLSFEGVDLTTTSEECPGKRDCPFGDVCFAEGAKLKAKDANIILVNHAVLANDVRIKESQILNGVPEDKATGILPPFYGGVIDEAHDLEDYVTSALGEQLTAGSLNRLGRDAANYLGQRDAAKTMLEHTEAVYKVVRAELAKRQNKADRSYLFTADTLESLSDPIFDLLNSLTALMGKIAFGQVYGDDAKAQKQKRLVKRIQAMTEKLRDLMTADFTQMVRWLNVADGIKGESIEWAPLSVAGFLSKNLWSTGSFLVMSATLDFAFTASSLGFHQYDTFDAGTPFDFATQAITFVPQLSHPVPATKEQWRAGAIATAGELVEASNGRALFLYTSRKEMDEAYAILGPMIRRMGHATYRQGDAPTKVLAQKFKDDENSCLFAMKSFFTGIDIQGDSLRLVVIDKLPFPVPTDVLNKARCDAIDKGRNPFSSGGSFWVRTVPLMSLQIRQAYGRLIRTVDDWGAVAIMDSRLYGSTQKTYGPKIMKSIQADFNAPVVTTLPQAVAFLTERA